MHTINRRFLPASQRRLNLNKRMDGDEETLPEIAGTAAVFFDSDDPDGTQYQLWRDTYERIMPGAFDNIGNDDVRALQNHDPRMLLGRSTSGTLTLATDSVGLNYVIDTPDTTIGRDTVTSLERGDITGSSFAFSVVRASWIEDDDGITWFRQIEEVRTYDVGPVTFPAYSGTESGVRAARGITLIDNRSQQQEVEELKAEFDDHLKRHYHAPQRAERERTMRLLSLSS